MLWHLDSFFRVTYLRVVTVLDKNNSFDFTQKNEKLKKKQNKLQVAIVTSSWNIYSNRLDKVRLFDSLGSLSSLWYLLHDFNEFVGPVACRADVDAEEILLGRRRHGERVPLQLWDGWAVDEDILTHLHFETILYQLQLQHFRGSHDNLKTKHMD